MKQLELFTPENPIKLRDDYTTIIVSYSTGIDSMGALHWALANFPKEKILLLYCDTGLEYDINDQLFINVASFLEIRRKVLKHPLGFIGILETRGKFPDMKNRWCTSYLKTDITNMWIRANRPMLGERVLFITGERRDESPRRSRLPELALHSTTLKTERKGKFLCHWLRPCLDYEKGKMFEWGKNLRLDPHPCYEYVNRCSCMACVFMPNYHAIENMKRNPDKFKKLIQAEIRYSHTWKRDVSLKGLWEQHCEDVPLDIVV